MATATRSRWWWALVVLIVAGAIWWWESRVPDAIPPQNPKLQKITTLDGGQLIQLRNLSLGRLENHEYQRASQEFREILAALPGEPFGVRNLAISLVKQTVEGIDERAKPDEFAKSRAASLVAVQQLEDLDPKSGLPHFLRAVLATKSGDPRDILQPLKQAVEADPNNVPWKFQWFELGRQLRDTGEKTEAFEAGLSAAKLAPDNLFVQKEVLAEALARLADLSKTDPAAADAQSADVVSWLERLRDPLRVFGISIQVQAKIDVVRVLDDVIAAIKERNWQKARTEFFKIKNLLAQETASDADLLHPSPLIYHDPLNYVAFDFSPAFYERADLPSESLPRIEVTWKETDGALPDVSESVRQMGWLDFDLDGVADLVELNAEALVVHRRLPARAGWERVALPLEQSWSGFVAADLDDDVVIPSDDSIVSPDRCHEADPDFVLFGRSGVQIIHNTLDDETKARALELIPTEKSGWGEMNNVTQAKPVDFDHDGDLDLALVADGKLGLWLNRGNFSWTDAGANSLLPPDNLKISAIAVVDWDQDSDLDLLVSAAQGSGWMENLRHGRMRFHEMKDGWSGVNSLAVAEFDGDDQWDVLASGEFGARVVFTEITPQRTRRIKQRNEVYQSPISSVALLDYDNDGGVDLCFNGRVLCRNDGHGEFHGDTQYPPSHSPKSCVVAFADFDADGDLDVLAASTGERYAFSNEGGNKNHWLDVRIRAQQVKANEQGASRRVNHYGVGSTVEVKAGTRYQTQIADGQTTRFGLGPAEKADILRVVLTNGVPQNRIEPKANELVCERQVLQTSCPYLFTWSGERYEFVTDLIWASPLGLNATQTELMPWRDWEYLKIDGSKVKPIDGEYRLQITEELWEAAYFDQVRLIAVDHPADVDIYTNEKVGSAELAAHKIHTVREPKLPVSVRDQAGRDWLPQLSQRDEVYTRNYERKISQGLCDEHYLEFDLGELASSERVTLFLAGWIRPTDTNINVALDQNPELPSPTGLALWTPDALGNWRQVSPHIGFPNGKTKTIAIDPSRAFTPGDYRLRLVTNREFYWDQAFFTVDEEPAEVREIELPLLRANLHHRGVSRGILPAGDGPETYDYDQLAAIPPWPAMGGMFTRYGDVRSLLTKRDDQLLVMGAGDEVSLTFRVPDEPLPDGWVRDFVVYNVGWVKDCHLNTWEGERVEPLPFEKMNDHDYWTGRPEETGDYADYLRTFQTRRQTTPFRAYVREFQPEVKSALPEWERRRRNGD